MAFFSQHEAHDIQEDRSRREHSKYDQSEISKEESEWLQTLLFDSNRGAPISGSDVEKIYSKTALVNYLLGFRRLFGMSTVGKSCREIVEYCRQFDDFESRFGDKYRQSIAEDEKESDESQQSAPGQQQQQQQQHLSFPRSQPPENDDSYMSDRNSNEQPPPPTSFFNERRPRAPVQRHVYGQRTRVNARRSPQKRLFPRRAAESNFQQYAFKRQIERSSHHSTDVEPHAHTNASYGFEYSRPQTMPPYPHNQYPREPCHCHHCWRPAWNPSLMSPYEGRNFPQPVYDTLFAGHYCEPPHGYHPHRRPYYPPHPTQRTSMHHNALATGNSVGGDFCLRNGGRD